MQGRYEVGIMVDEKVAREPFRVDTLDQAAKACDGTPKTKCRPYVFDLQSRSFVVAAGNPCN